MNHREVLGVSKSASAGEIKQAFRKAAKEVHPDHSDSPEAAQAFTKIKQAHDALIKDSDGQKESTGLQSATAHASAKTAQATYATPDPDLSYEEIAHIQGLDEQARQSPKRSLFKKTKEPEEVKRHRKKLETNTRRLRGLY